VTDKCPYCDFEAADTQEEIDHMNAEHPEIIHERLEKAGLPDERNLDPWHEIERLQGLYQAQTENYSEENEARARAQSCQRDRAPRADAPELWHRLHARQSPAP
jgi:hypothetical protein